MSDPILRQVRRVPIHLYEQHGPEPSDGDEPVGTVWVEHWASRIVEAMAKVREYERAIAAVALLHDRYRGMGDPIDSCSECSRTAGHHVPYDMCTTRAALRGAGG